MRVCFIVAALSLGLMGAAAAASNELGRRINAPGTVQTDGGFQLAQNVRCGRLGCRPLRPGCRIFRPGGFRNRVICDGPGNARRG
jgi:hypothetical protein